MKGMLDRFEGDKAVILIEESKTELVVWKSELPGGSKVDTVFLLEKSEGNYKILSIDAAGTKGDAQKSSDLMAKLRSKRSGSKFGKK